MSESGGYRAKSRWYPGFKDLQDEWFWLNRIAISYNQEIIWTIKDAVWVGRSKKFRKYSENSLGI